MKNAFLIGASVYLRPLEVSDAPVVQPWFNDPEVRHTLLRYHPVTLLAEEDYLRHQAKSENDLALGIVTRAEDRLIGAGGLHYLDVRCRHAALGLLIGDSTMWGKGYGTETTRLIVDHAFRTLNLNRVWLHVYEYNDRGLRAYLRAGFREEGRLRQHAFAAGRYWDVVSMGILREEWMHRAETV